MDDSICKWSILTSVVFSLFLMGCKRGEETMPAYTHDGRNTLGYYVSTGEYFGGNIRQSDISWVDSLDLLEVYYFSEDVHGFEENQLWLWMAKEDGLFYLDSSEYRGDWTNEMLLDTNVANAFEITYQDTSRRILSGHFDLNFSDIRIDTSWDGTVYIDTIDYANLTRGRFDIRLPSE